MLLALLKIYEIMLLASKLCYLIFKQNKGRASGKIQNKQQLITDYIQYKITKIVHIVEVKMQIMPAVLFFEKS